MTEQNRQWSRVGLGRPGRGRPLRRLPRFATDGRSRADEGGNTAPQHSWVVQRTRQDLRFLYRNSQVSRAKGRKGERENARAEVGERSVDWYVGLSPSRGKQTGLLSVGCCPPQVESECLAGDERGIALLRRSR